MFTVQVEQDFTPIVYILTKYNSNKNWVIYKPVFVSENVMSVLVP